MSNSANQEGRIPSHYQWQTVDQTSDPEWFIRFLDTSRGPLLAAIQQNPQQVYAYLDVKEGQHILDIGSGTGDLSQPLARLVGPSGRVVGVDYSQTMVNEARKRAEQSGSTVEFYQGDIHHLEFEDNTFDRVQARLVFQHLPEPRQPLSELMRVTKPGGRIAVVEQDWETLMMDAEDRRVTRTIANLFCDNLPNGWIGRQLAGLFKEAGLQDVTASGATTILPPNYEMVSRLLDFDTVLDQAKEQGHITADEAAAWQRDMQQRSEVGRFFMAFVLFTVTGQKAS